MLTILSGGQTGVDRAALDAALALGISCGGWCPRGRRAEDGRIPDRYPLTETPSADPAQRTAWNAFDGDATLVIGSITHSPGTALAASVARRFGRPVFGVEPAEGGAAIRRWLHGLPRPLILNVAGPRESEAPGIQQRAGELLRDLLSDGPAIWPSGNHRDSARLALVTGGAGLLGRELVRLAPPGWTVHWTVRRGAGGPTAHPVELADGPRVTQLVDDLRPSAVFHTAYTARDPARDIGEATRNIARAAAAVGAHLVHLSSDMVHDGKHAPYDEAAAPAPINLYGRWKADAEAAVTYASRSTSIVRLSLITCFDPPDPRTSWILAALEGSNEAQLYVDELRSPIMVDDLARQLWEIARLEGDQRSGVWNLAGPESMSRLALGCLVGLAFSRDASVLRGVASPAGEEPRPKDLRLTTTRADRYLLTRPRGISEAAADHRERQHALSEQPR